MKQKYNTGQIVWYNGPCAQNIKNYGFITHIYVNIVHVCSFDTGKLEVMFPQTFGTHWGIA